MFSHYRLEGFRTALQEAGLSLSDDCLMYGNLTRQGGKAAAEKLLECNPGPTAIVAANDLTALGAISAVQEAGLEVGRDISITGFDDITPAEYLGLTTLRQPIYDIGRQLCQMLTQMIEEESVVPQQVLLKPELIVRNTTMAPGL
jgi:LacI family transcriptional regulator